MARPPQNIIRGEAEMYAASGLKRTARGEQIESGHFPPPIKLGPRAKGWLADEIADWQEWKRALRDGAFGGSFVDWQKRFAEEEDRSDE